MDLVNLKCEIKFICKLIEVKAIIIVSTQTMYIMNHFKSFVIAGVKSNQLVGARSKCLIFTYEIHLGRRKVIKGELNDVQF